MARVAYAKLDDGDIKDSVRLLCSDDPLKTVLRSTSLVAYTINSRRPYVVLT